MRPPPLIFAVLIILFTLALGFPQRSTRLRRANASISDTLAAGDALRENGAEAADSADVEMIGPPLGDGDLDPKDRPNPLDFPRDIVFGDPARRVELQRRTELIKQAFLHSWNNYKRLSLGQSGDELKPKTGKPENSRNGWGVTAVDALSTAIIMNLAEPVNDIVKHIRTVDFTKSRTKQTISLFETTIRYLGGMLSGYDLLNEPNRRGLLRNGNDIKILLNQATSLANSLSVAFQTPSGMPYDQINQQMTGPGAENFDMWNATNYLSQAGTLILEWTRLSNLTGNRTYANLARRAENNLTMPVPRAGAIAEPFPGLLGNEIYVFDGAFKHGSGGWGGGSDSFYEYLIKTFIYDAHGYNRVLRNKWAKAVDSSRKYLASYPFPVAPRQPTYRPPFFDLKKIISAIYPGAGQFLNIFPFASTPKHKPRPALMQTWESDRTRNNVSQHLTCFDGGNVLLGAQVLYESIHTPRMYGKWTATDLDDIYHFGLDLVEGCRYVYSHTSTGIGPDYFSWKASDTINQKAPYFSTPEAIDKQYGLRPEVLESYYYAYRISGDPIYQDWAWEAFLAFEKYCKTEFGYTSIRDVNLWLPPASDTVETKKRIEGNWLDQQESFWLAETLKYLYLIMIDDDEEWQVPRGYGFPTLADIVNQKPLPSYPRWPGQQNKYVYNTEAHPLRVVGPEL